MSEIIIVYVFMSVDSVLFIKLIALPRQTAETSARSLSTSRNLFYFIHLVPILSRVVYITPYPVEYPGSWAQ